MQEDIGHSMVSPPTWLADETWLRALLNWFLDRLEQPRSRAITRRITRSTIPELFHFDGDAVYLVSKAGSAQIFSFLTSVVCEDCDQILPISTCAIVVEFHFGKPP